MADTVSVTQADRALFFDLFEISERNREKVMRGEEDWRPQMQRIAAFRLAPTQPAPAFPREEGHDLLLLRAMLCLSGFSGEGLCVDGFGDPADLYSEIAHSIGMEDADDETLRRHIVIEQQRATLLQGKQP